MNKFEQVSSDGHQMSLVGEVGSLSNTVHCPGATGAGGGPVTVRSNAS